LVTECQNALSAPASLIEVTVVWVPGHCGIPGNEETDKLARQASAMPLLGLEPVLEYLGLQEETQLRTGLSTNIILLERFTSHRHGKFFIGRPCKRRTEDLLKLSTHQLKMAVAILTGHAPVRKHLQIMGLFDGDPTCRFCWLESQTVQHIICCCEVLARQRYNFFGKLFAEPQDISTASVRDLCLLIRGTGLLDLC
jgi:hypothetical protein